VNFGLPKKTWMIDLKLGKIKKIIGFGMAIKSFGLASIFSRKGVEKWRENML